MNISALQACLWAFMCHLKDNTMEKVKMKNDFLKLKEKKYAPPSVGSVD